MKFKLFNNYEMLGCGFVKSNIPLPLYQEYRNKINLIKKYSPEIYQKLAEDKDLENSEKQIIAETLNINIELLSSKIIKILRLILKPVDVETEKNKSSDFLCSKL